LGSGELDIRSLTRLGEAIAASTGHITLRVERRDQVTTVTIPVVRSGSPTASPFQATGGLRDRAG
jgi:hypothetical protein